MSSIQDQRLLQPFDSHSIDVIKGSLLLTQLHVLHLICKHLILGLLSVLTQCFAFEEDFDHTELAINISV